MSLSLHEAAEVGRLLSGKCKPKPSNSLEDRIQNLERQLEGMRVLLQRCERKIENHALGRVLINGRPLMGHPEVQEIRALIIWIAEKFGTTGDAILSKAKPVELVWVRHVAMWIARKSTLFSTPVIGKAFRRDHGAILHAVSSINARMETDTKARDQVNGLMDEWVKFRDGQRKNHEGEKDIQGSSETLSMRTSGD